VTGSLRPKVKDDLVTTVVDGEMVVFDPAEENVHLLNPQAAVAFQCFDGEGTIDEIAADIADAFSLPSDAVTGDLERVYEEFKRNGLIEGFEMDPFGSVPRRTTTDPEDLEDDDNGDDDDGDDNGDDDGEDAVGLRGGAAGEEDVEPG
jgi:hypothetical protein